MSRFYEFWEVKGKIQQAKFNKDHENELRKYCEEGELNFKTCDLNKNEHLEFFVYDYQRHLVWHLSQMANGLIRFEPGASADIPSGK